MAVTLKEVADRTGLSFQTVSKVLSGRQRHLFRPETAERVMRVADEMGYRPNTSARAMRAGKLHCVALLLSTNEYRSHLPDRLLEGIHDTLAEHGLRLIISRLPDEKLTQEGYVPKVLSEWSCDGLLVNYTDHIPPRMVELIEQHSVPAVWINTKLARDCVRHDDERGGYEATRHLLELGHTRVAYLQMIDWDAHYSTTDRTAGYQRAMREAGLQPMVWGNLDEVKLTAEAMPASRRTMVHRLRARLAEQRPTAFVCYGPVEAYFIVRAAEQVGIDLEHKCSIVAFAEDRLDQMGLPLSLMLLPGYEVGRHAVQMLLAGQRNSPAITVPSQLVPFIGAEQVRSALDVAEEQ